MKKNANLDKKATTTKKVVPKNVLSTQLKAILITSLLIGATEVVFGAISFGLFIGQEPVVNNYYESDTYNNYTDYITYYNTTYIYNNQTGEQSIYNCCHFQVDTLPQGNISYFFNLTLEHKTVIELVSFKNDGGNNFQDVTLRYNFSIGENSTKSTKYFFYMNAMGNAWYIEPEGNYKIDLPHILPNGTNYVCQFRIDHNDVRLGKFQIIVGYTVYL